MTQTVEGKPFIVGIAGGTASGKTMLANIITDCLTTQDVVTIQHDSYYKDRSDLSPHERENINYDHPNSLDTDLMICHLKELISGNAIEAPIYDFAAHCRSGKRTQVMPAKVIIVEGILLLADAALRELLDVKIFVDTDNDIRFIRRLQRDIKERNRTVDSVVKQYMETTRTMYINFVEPSKKHADIIITDSLNPVVIEMIACFIKKKLK